MNDNYEMRVIEYESSRNEAMDKWFSARPDIERNSDSEKLYEGGFRMAWESSRSPACSISAHERKCIAELDYAITVLDGGDSKLSQADLLRRCHDLLNGEIDSIFGN